MVRPLLVSNEKPFRNDFERVIPYSQSVYDLSCEISNDLKTIPEKAVFIDIEAKDQNDIRQNHLAIDVVFYLRCLHKLLNPIICLGFESLSSILHRKPSQLVLSSPGTKYLQLPITPESIQECVFPPMSQHEFEKLKLFLKGAYSIEQFRHQHANWWGVYRLLYAHNLVLTHAHKKPVDPPTVLTEEISHQINSVENVIAQFIYSVNSNSIEHQLISFRNRIHSLTTQPKILYIDDMANMGWAKVLQEIIYEKQDNNNFKIIAPKENETDQTILDKVFNSIITNKPDCVLLDLRLKNEKSSAFATETLSGAKVLKSVKSAFPSLPVIIFTASNKANTLKKLLESRCDYLWTKEGMDEMHNANTSLQNYCELTELIYQAVTKFKHLVEKKLYSTEIKLSHLKFKGITKIKSNLLNNQDVILTDTNVWLHRKTEKVHQALYILMKNCNNALSPQFIVIDQVFDEVIRISKEKIDSDFVYPNGSKIKSEDRFMLRKTARWVEPILQEYYDERLVIKDYFDFNKANEKQRENFNRYAYADKYFIEKVIPSYLKDGLRVLFITNDIECKRKINDALSQGHKQRYSDIDTEQLINLVFPKN